MGFSRNSTAPVKEVRENLTQGATSFKRAGSAAARGTREAAAPRVNVVLTKVGLKKRRAPKWPWVAAGVGAGVTAAAGAVAYLMYRRRSESLGESLLADELLDDTEEAERRQQPQITDEAINEELVDSVSR
ncbi:hypothetical protein [Glycomyces xiaoerkulensis]|uniref:hypothetical protein n=1 Tax=Glycomyces xiaoerkulensis TaxID=2038139 RepID=UPI00130000FC|nr:hypothetical protein [Glycomyces xiaoerkulensis]